MMRRGRRRRDELACIQFVEVVTDYLEEAMAPEARARLEAHLTGCDGCEAYLDQIRTTVTLAGRLTVDDVDALDPGARDALLEAFRAYRAGA
jgi:predicted anti-sigma-YlaC factor YlaD